MPKKRKPLSQLPQTEAIATKRSRNEWVQDTQNELVAGTIKSMTLKNFMCHSLLEVKFDRNVNFLIGKNGSGKSAILTALIVGLGGKASVTNRGSSLKGFVKAGENSGSVEIVLNNTGHMAYKLKQYGPHISIQRNFTLSGSGGYKIRSAAGAVITTKAKEVHNITNSLNIQVTNPVCILNQDTSRNFLSSSDTKMRYNLFKRATRLDTLYEEYRQGLNNKKNASKIFIEKNKILTQLTNELENLKERIESHRSVQGVKENRDKLSKELLWSKVHDAELQLHEHQAVYDGVKENNDELKYQLENREQVLKEIRDRVAEINQQINQLKESAEIQDQPIRECVSKRDLLKRRVTEKIRQKDSLLRAIDKKKQDCESVKKEIANFTAKMTEIEQQRLQKQTDISTLEEKYKKMQELINTFENESFQCSNDVQSKEQELRNVREELEAIKSKCNSVKQNISSLKGETNNPLAIYGRDMGNLVLAINNAKNKFSQPPKGPLGSYISVKNKKWSVAVEGFIGRNLLHAFCVNSDEDAKLLFKLMEQNCHGRDKPTVITSKFFSEVHNVTQNLVQKGNGCLSIFDAIKVSDPVVMNCLIDQLGIESILLIPTFDQAMQLMSLKENVPYNCSRGITAKGDQFYPQPNYKMYSSRYHDARYLQVDTADIVRQYTKDLQELEAKRHSLEDKFNTTRTEVNNRNSKLQEIRNKLEKCNRGSRVAKMKIIELQSTDDSEIGNVQVLESEVKSIEHSIQEHQESIAEIETEIEETRNKTIETDEKLSKLREASKAFETRILPLEEQVREQFTKKQSISTSAEYDKRRLNESNTKLKDAKTEVELAQRDVDAKVQQAEYLCERLTDVRPVLILMEEIDRCQRKINQAKALNENINDLMAQLMNKMQVHDSISTVLCTLSNDLDELKQAYEHRKRHYISTRDYFQNFVKHNFEKFLKIRQFRGTIDINFEEEELDMKVQPTVGGHGITTTTNLSGGERSFSTVAFLYSLWQCLPFPFYFLDEFDVFMDKANRTKVMEILIHHAKSKPSTQFVFLTPQDVSFIDDDDVDIHKLEDPIRRFTQ